MSAKHSKQVRRDRRRGETRNDRHQARIRLNAIRNRDVIRFQEGIEAGSQWHMEHMFI